MDWDERGLPLFAQPDGIFEVLPEGGEPRLIVAATDGEELASPRLLPGGRAVPFTATTAAGADRWDAGRIMMQWRSAQARAWVYRDGRQEPLPVQPDDYTKVRISPNGRQAALVVGDALDGARVLEIAIVDLETHALRQLTFGLRADAPMWSHDGSRLYFRSTRAGAQGVYSVPAAGGEPEMISTARLTACGSFASCMKGWM